MSTQYWVRNGSAVTGPYDQLQIRGLVAIGQLTRSMELSNDGKRWVSAESIKGLFAPPSAFTDIRSKPAMSEDANAHNAVPARPPAASELLLLAAPRKAPLLRWVVIVSGIALAAVGTVTTLRDSKADISCSNPRVVNLATNLLYEDFAKRSNAAEDIASSGRQATADELKLIEEKFHEVISLTINTVSTVGTRNQLSQCKAILHVATTPATKTSRLMYFGEGYADGESLSYSVRLSDDGKNFYVHIPAE